MFCMECGSQMSDCAVFCGRCGQPVGTVKASKKDSHVGKAVGAAADKLYEVTGGTGHVQLKFQDFFSEVFKQHDKGESDEIFVCGTAKTTPNIQDVAAEWPKPWVWSRVLVALLVTLALLYALFAVFGNKIAIPGIMFMGALVAPFSVLIFLFETNIPRNISLVETISIFFVGGVASLVALYLLPTNILSASGTGDLVSSMLTGFLEETAKVILIVVVFSLRKNQGRHYVLNGLLIGGAIGAGFAVFETAGYIYYLSDSVGTMSRIIVIRGVLALGGHVAWAAAEGAALALGEQEEQVQVGQVVNPVSLSVFVLKNPAFLTVFAICIVLHGVWDMNVPVIDDVPLMKYILLVVVIWIVIAVLLNRGLDQVNELAAVPMQAEVGAVAERAMVASPSAEAQSANSAKLTANDTMVDKVNASKASTKEGNGASIPQIADAISEAVAISEDNAFFLASETRSQESISACAVGLADGREPVQITATNIPRFCGKCGTPLSENAKFCPSCGVKVQC